MWTAGCWRRSSRCVASAAALASALQAGSPQAIAECTLGSGDEARVYRIVDHGPAPSPRWRLTLRTPALRGRVIELPLPEARVQRADDRVTIASRSGNGGLAVKIDAAAGRSMIDVFVNFELEVNVWRDLSPDVERMNTEGPREGRCRVLPPPAP